MCAERMSLSPKVISSVDTESFSLMIARTFKPVSFSIRFFILSFLLLLFKSSLVNKTWAIAIPRGLEHDLYSCINRLCPTEAEHWLSRVSLAFFQFRLLFPKPIAPLDTSMKLFPESFKEDISFSKEVISLLLNLPFWLITIFVPNLITILFVFLSSFLARNTITLGYFC